MKRPPPESFPPEPEPNVFVLPQDKWDEFVAMLDEPPKSSPKLRALFARKSRIVTDREDK